MAPPFVGAFGLILEYARLRMLLAALEAGDATVALGLAAPAGVVTPTVTVEPPPAAGGLLVPGR